MMDLTHFDLMTGDLKALIRGRLHNASCESRETEDLKILFQFSHGPAMTQLKRLQQALRTLGTRVSFIGLSMTVVMNMEDILMGTIKSIDRCCPNLKSFYATGLFIRNKEFNENQLKTFFARLEEIILQMCGLEGVNTFSDCKKLKGWTWTQEIFNGFEGECLNFNFDDLRSIKFSKIDGIDSEHMQPFLLKNPHLKSITLTRCTIDANILKLISKHVPAIEEFTFNFRRSLVHRSDMQKNLKYLLKLQHLKALNLDCVGAAVGDVFSKMAGNPIPLERVGLFCFPWENSLIKAFGNLKDLKSLHLSNVTGLNDECLGYLSQSLVGLNDLTLKFIENITLDGVIKLMAKCQLLSTATIVLSKLTTISTDRYSMLLEAIKERPEKVKLTITLWESKNPLKLPKDLLNQNLEFLEILVEENELNKNTDFDFYCDSADGGYDVVSSTSPQDSGCFINCCLF